MLSVDTMLAETVFAFCILLLHGIVYQLQIKCYYSRFTSPYSHKGNTWFTLVRECILLGLFKFGEALSLTHLHMLLLKPKITVPIIKEKKKKRDLLPITFRYTVLKHSLRVWHRLALSFFYVAPQHYKPVLLGWWVLVDSISSTISCIAGRCAAVLSARSQPPSGA